MCICGGRSLKTSVVRIQWKSGLERSPYSWRPERTFSKLGKRTWSPPAGLGPIGGTRGLCVMAARPPSLTLPACGPVPSRPNPRAPATCPHPETPSLGRPQLTVALSHGLGFPRTRHPAAAQHTLVWGVGWRGFCKEDRSS